MPRIFVCGEALIDFVPGTDQSGSPHYIPKPGGSPYNTAMAAALAGGVSYFLGVFSQDFFGETLLQHLAEARVDCSLASRSDRPTTLAFVDLSEGSPRYAFFDNGSANANIDLSSVSISPDAADLLHIGSISLDSQPGGENICDFAVMMSRSLMLSVDPNVRPGIIRDRQEWLERMERLFKAATIIKLSVEDLEYIDPNASGSDFAATMLRGGSSLVIVTNGDAGATVYSRRSTVTVSAPVTGINDTVGAGDTLTGATLTWIADSEYDSSESIAHINQRELASMMLFAVGAATLNCQRVGCDPPCRSEIKEFLDKLGGECSVVSASPTI